jgi:hypothetical protein
MGLCWSLCGSLGIRSYCQTIARKAYDMTDEVQGRHWCQVGCTNAGYQVCCASMDFQYSEMADKVWDRDQ